MAESETGLSDLMDVDEMDVEDTSYEADFDVEVLDGFHLENAFY